MSNYMSEIDVCISLILSYVSDLAVSKPFPGERFQKDAAQLHQEVWNQSAIFSNLKRTSPPLG